MNLNIDTKTKNLILMIASIVIVAAFLILPIVSASANMAGQSKSESINGLDILTDKDAVTGIMGKETPALVVVGSLLVIAGGGAAIYFSAVKFNQPNYKQFFMYSAIGAAVGAVLIMLGWSEDMKTIQDAFKQIKDMGGSASIGYGFGFWLSLIASAACIAGCFVKANDEQ
ncbi:MAG: hypothetical protein IKW04_03765 [Clostridia bacterium]|nr:hypothetical protein [Clostridia bacterium]